jgi:hypothetical protein
VPHVSPLRRGFAGSSFVKGTAFSRAVSVLSAMRLQPLRYAW